MRIELKTILYKYLDMAEIELFGNTYEDEEENTAILIDELKDFIKRYQYD